MTTQWRDVTGYEGLYRVSDAGQIEAFAKAVPVPGRGVDFRPARILVPSTHPNGHQRVVLSKGGKRVARWVHRLVAEAFLPNPDDCPLVNHIDSNPANNAVSNLEWTTHSGNTRHAFDKGRIVLPPNRGEANSQAFLTGDIVRAIRVAYESTPNASRVAKSFGVSSSTVRDICNYRRWSHIS